MNTFPRTQDSFYDVLRGAAAGALLASLMFFEAPSARATYPNNINDDEDELGQAALGLPIGDTRWMVSEPYINLWMVSHPWQYQTSLGHKIDCALAFKQRNSRAEPVNSGPIPSVGWGWECSFISYVKYTYAYPLHVSGSTTYILGGQRTYTLDGVTRHFQSGTTMNVVTNADGTVVRFEMNMPSGAKRIYDYRFTNYQGELYAFLGEELDAQGRTILTYSYQTENQGLSTVRVRLYTIFDCDGYSISLGYSNPSYTDLITSIGAPYQVGANVSLVYEYGSRALTNLARSGLFTNTVLYGGQAPVAQLITPYGTNQFRATTNAFAPYNLGGSNAVNRSVEVTETDGSKQLYLYRDQSTKLNPSSTVDLIPNSYPSGEVPNTAPFTNTLDNQWMDARNSFHWNRKQYSSLSTNFKTTGDFNNLSTNDYKIAQLRHWLRAFTNAAVVTDTISLARDASADGTMDGQKYWFDYAGKLTNWWTRGTNAQPLFSALILPDGNTRFSYTERTNRWENPTRLISTYASAGSVATRTNSWRYSSNGIDMIEYRGVSGELLSSNAYNGYHQVLTNYNAVNDMTVYAYDSMSRITNIVRPNAFQTRYWYYGNGWPAPPDCYNRLWEIENVGINSKTFDWLNCTVASAVDERGMTTYYSWDDLNRLTDANCDVGTASLRYSRLDLERVIAPSGNVTSRYVNDAIRGLGIQYDGRGSTNAIGYACGLISCVTNALGQTNAFSYDSNSRLLSKTYHDKTAETYRYDRLGQMTNQMDAVGISVTNWYNHQGLVASVSNAFGRLFNYKYDIYDRVTNTVDGNNVTNTCTYDALGRVVTRTVSGGGAEGYQYTAQGLMGYTNQLGLVTRYGYDGLGRKTAETNANGAVFLYTYNGAGDLTSITDPKNNVIHWDYDELGRRSTDYDATVHSYYYDADSHVTNLWSSGKGATYYAYDQNGNVTNINHAGFPSTANVRFAYDALNRVTNMVDGIGTNRFTYTSFGAVETEDGPWDSDTITYSYQTNHVRGGLSLAQPNASPWTASFGYDTAGRLQTLSSPAGSFTYAYSAASLMKKLTMPSGAYVTNIFDALARRTGTLLMSSGNAVLNSHAYLYNDLNQRTRQTRTDGSHVDYTYDNIGQVRTAVGREVDGTLRLNENFGYGYDGAGNLMYRTNNAMVETYSLNSYNQVTLADGAGTLTVSGNTSTPATNVTVNGLTAARYADNTFAKDNLPWNDGDNVFTVIARDAYGSTTNTIHFYYPSYYFFGYEQDGGMDQEWVTAYDFDAEDRLWHHWRYDWASGYLLGKTEFLYDGQNRLRIRKEYDANQSLIDEIHYIYDGRLVIQERGGNKVPRVTYTRGWDLSGTCCDAAGGIGGLLARTDNSQSPATHAYYHADANGNITMLIDTNQTAVARYLYNPYGNLLAKSGPLADANVYRFSSKEFHDKSGLYSFGRRFYDPNLQRWLNRDPSAMQNGANLYAFAGNAAIGRFDPWGLDSIKVDAFGLTKDDIYSGRTSFGVELFHTMGVTDYTIFSTPHASPDWDPTTKRCRLVEDVKFDAYIYTRYLLPDTYAFSPPPNSSGNFTQISAATLAGNSYQLNWRGITLDAAAVEDIRQHEHQHASIYYQWFQDTYVWYEKELAEFKHTPAGRQTNYKNPGQCDAAVNAYIASVDAEFTKIQQAADAAMVAAQISLDTKTILFQENDARTGFMRYLGDRPSQITDPRFLYDFGTGRFEAVNRYP